MSSSMLMDVLKDLVKRYLSLPKKTLVLEIVVLRLKSSIRWYVVVSLKCCVYSVWSQEVDRRAQLKLGLNWCSLRNLRVFSCRMVYRFFMPYFFVG